MAVGTELLGENQVGRPRSDKITARRRNLLGDLLGISPTLALYGAFVVIPTCFALFLSFTNWDVIGPLKWAGFSNWSRFFSDPVAHHSLLVTFELAGLSWLAQTPLAMALGIFVAGRQRYRAVYAAIYLVPLLLSTAGLSLMWEDVLFPQYRRTRLARCPLPHELPQPKLDRELQSRPFYHRSHHRMAVHPVPYAHFPGGQTGHTGGAL